MRDQFNSIYLLVSGLMHWSGTLKQALFIILRNQYQNIGGVILVFHQQLHHLKFHRREP